MSMTSDLRGIVFQAITEEETWLQFRKGQARKASWRRGHFSWTWTTGKACGMWIWGKEKIELTAGIAKGRSCHIPAGLVGGWGKKTLVGVLGEQTLLLRVVGKYRLSPARKGRGVLKQVIFWDFPGGPVVKTLPSNAGGAGLIPGRGAEIPHASWPNNQNT